MPPRSRLHAVGTSRRRRRDDDGEDEGSAADGGMDDESSLSEGSIISHQDDDGNDDDADGEGSEEEEEDDDDDDASISPPHARGHSVNGRVDSSSLSPVKQQQQHRASSDTEINGGGAGAPEGEGAHATPPEQSHRQQPVKRTPSAPLPSNGKRRRDRERNASSAWRNSLLHDGSRLSSASRASRGQHTRSNSRPHSLIVDGNVRRYVEWVCCPCVYADAQKSV